MERWSYRDTITICSTKCGVSMNLYLREFGSNEFVFYQENSSMNHSGDKPCSNKVVKHYAVLSLGNKCYVALF